jgi:hypothetical protein
MPVPNTKCSNVFPNLQKARRPVLISHRFFYRAHGKPDFGVGERRTAPNEAALEELLEQGGPLRRETCYRLQAKGYQ